MKYRFATLPLLFFLFALPVNRAEACGSDGAGHDARFHEEMPDESCCATDKVPSNCCASDSEQQPGNAGCPCDHENGACQCPGCHVIIHYGPAFMLETPPSLTAGVFNFSLRRQAFCFSGHLPEAVYLPIWQPPKIGE